MNDVRIIALIGAGHMVSHFLALLMIFTVVHVRRRVAPRPVLAPGG